MALIPWWIRYPNVNDEIMNLDWLLRVSNENTEKISNFINLNTIKYANPILWDITSQYEANTVTVDPQTGDAYISTKAVPYGVALSNTDYWTKIYNYADEINELQEQIAAANEELSTTATAPRAIDDLVWLNGFLYKVTAPMIAGDSYVVGSNCIKTTVEEELKKEMNARTEADAALGERITSEAEARTEADTALGERITSEAGERAEADIALGERIDSLPTENDLDFINVLEHGLFNDGQTDNASALQSLINSVTDHTRLYFPSGTYLINDNIRITKPLHLYGDGFGDVTSNTNGSGRGSTTIVAGSNVADLFIIGNENNYIFDCSIENMLIDGATYVNTAITLFSGVMCNFINLHIRQCKVAGIFISCYDDVLCQFNRICNYDYVYGASSITENSKALVLNGGSTAQVTQNYIENIRTLCKNDYCISISNSDNNVFTKCFGVSEVGTLSLNNNANNNYIDYMGGGKILQSASYGNKINHLISEGSAVTNLDGKPLWYDVEDYITGENYKSDFYWLSKTIDISVGDFLLMNSAGGFMNGNGIGFIGFTGSGALCYSSKFKNFRHGTLSSLALYVAGTSAMSETLDLKASVLTDSGSVAVTDKTGTVSINTPVVNTIYKIVVPLDLTIDKDQLFNITLSRTNTSPSDMMILGAQLYYLDNGPVGIGSGPYAISTIDSINN